MSDFVVSSIRFVVKQIFLIMSRLPFHLRLKRALFSNYHSFASIPHRFGFQYLSITLQSFATLRQNYADITSSELNVLTDYCVTTSNFPTHLLSNIDRCFDLYIFF